MDAIHFSDLADGGAEQGRDAFAFQRNVLGVWTDYQTNPETYYGPIQTRIIEWDMSGPLAESIAPQTPGNYIVMLSGFVAFTAGNSPTSALVQIQIFQGSSSGQYLCEFNDVATSMGIIAYPLSDPVTDAYTDLDQDLNIFDNGAGPWAGTSRVIIQYVEVEPI